MANFLDKFLHEGKMRTVIIFSTITVVFVVFLSVMRLKSTSAPAGKAALPGIKSGDVDTGQPISAEKLSPQYQQLLLGSEKAKTTAALKKGASALPLLIQGSSQQQNGGEQLTVSQGQPTASNGSSGTGTSSNNCVTSCCQQCCATPSMNATELLSKYVGDGSISPAVADEIHHLQDNNAPISDYKDLLDRLVQEGKITPEQERQLLAAYRGQQATTVAPSESGIQQTTVPTDPDVAKQLKEIMDEKPTIGDFAADLNRLVKDGKLTPEQARELLNAYRQKASQLTQAESHSGSLSSMVKSGRISPSTAATLQKLHDRGLPTSEYAEKLAEMARDGRISPQDAKDLLSTYKAEHGDTSVPTVADKDMANLMKVQQQANLKDQENALDQLSQQQQDQQSQVESDTANNYQSAMNSQVEGLIKGWGSTKQEFKAGKVDTKKTAATAGAASAAGASVQRGATGSSAAAGVPLVKAGTIMFAVLDTSIDTDQQGPVMATIVSGKFKGAKLTGSIQRANSNTRVILQFNAMTMPEWSNMLKIDAVAINPDTAKFGLASEVDHHYISRYGMLFASSFLSGYAKALKSPDNTVLSQFGITQTHPELSPKDRLLVAFGEMGTNVSTYAKQQFNKPITIKVDAGVGVGVLFTKPVTLTGQ